MTPRKSDERFAQVEMRASCRGAELAKATTATRHVAEQLLHGDGTLLSKLGRAVLVQVSKVRDPQCKDVSRLCEWNKPKCTAVGRQCEGNKPRRFD